jgi:hypothetical protein
MPGRKAYSMVRTRLCKYAAHPCYLVRMLKGLKGQPPRSSTGERLEGPTAAELDRV